MSADAPESGFLDKTPTFAVTGVDSPVAKVGLLLIGDDGEQLYPGGTAFFISPCLAVTARHVIHSMWDKLETKPRTKRRLAGRFAIYAVQFINGEPLRWRAAGVVSARFTDVAFLHLEPDDTASKAYAFTWGATVNVAPLKAGDRLAGFGYPFSEGSIFYEGADRRYNLSLQPHTTSGEVVEVFPIRRDRGNGMLNFACAAINSRIEPGMSGGPVFNEAGEICALNCASSIPEDGAYKSFVAMLWPSLVTHLEFCVPGIEAVHAPYPIFALARDGIVHMKGWEDIAERLEFRDDPDRLDEELVALRDPQTDGERS